MKHLSWLAFGALVVATSALARADEPSLADWTMRRIEAAVLRPLAELLPPRFSRVRVPPVERRARVLQDNPSFDGSGRAFVPFAVDVRFGESWRENEIVGCAYVQSGEVFVKRGDGFRPAEVLLGKKVAANAGACEVRR